MATEPVDLIPAEPEPPVLGNHFGIQSWGGYITIGVVLLTINFNDNPYSD